MTGATNQPLVSRHQVTRRRWVEGCEGGCKNPDVGGWRMRRRWGHGWQWERIQSWNSNIRLKAPRRKNSGTASRTLFLKLSSFGLSISCHMELILMNESCPWGKMLVLLIGSRWLVVTKQTGVHRIICWAEPHNGAESNNSRGSDDMLNNSSVLSDNSRTACWCRSDRFKRWAAIVPDDTGRRSSRGWKVRRVFDNWIVKSRRGGGSEERPWGLLSTHGQMWGLPLHPGTLSHSNAAISLRLPRVNTGCIASGHQWLLGTQSSTSGIHGNKTDKKWTNVLDIHSFQVSAYLSRFQVINDNCYISHTKVN